MIPAVPPFEAAPGFDLCLEEASRRCHETAARWSSSMNDMDRIAMIQGFYQAETLAKYALEQALEQSTDDYRSELIEQLEDEERHVNVFAGWDVRVEVPPRPKSRERAEFVWFVILLVNELTGYCQFMMLHALLAVEEYREEVEGIVLDEQRHIDRLLSWTAPTWDSPRGRVSRSIVQRFRDQLSGRMSQFFPREGLEALRDEMAHNIAGLLMALPMAPETESD